LLKYLKSKKGKHENNKQSKSNWILALIALVISGCTSEKTAIEKGDVVLGMSKDAVITSRGFPPAHKTASLKLDSWIFCLTELKTKKEASLLPFLLPTNNGM